MGRNRIIGFALVLLASGIVSGKANAQVPECWATGATPANVLVVSGSTAVEPLYKAAAAGGLTAAAAIDIYSAGGGSCAGTDKFLQGADLAGLSAKHWDATGTLVTCTLPTGTKADFGVSDVFYPSCSSAATPLPAGFADTQGPIQPMVFVVPRTSMQKGLVAEEGYFVFGFGGATGKTVAPWTDMASLFIRDAGSGTQQMTARGVGLASGDLMKGTNAGANGAGSGGVVTALKGANASTATAEKAIGILGADVYDGARADLKALFFQGFKQTHGYLPDSTATALDKRNVRDGKYVIWGPSHFFAAVGADSKPTNAKVKDLFDYITGTKALSAGDFLDYIITGKYIPNCAMKVKRTAELGAVSAYTPEPGAACGCYMEEKLAAGSSKCTKCSPDGACAAGKKCSHGYCE
jgi:ABC-type phosphate transport system substrate-binding protein